MALAFSMQAEISTTTMDNYDSELIGASCELHVPYRGYSYATVVEDYGNELRVQLNSGKPKIRNYHPIHD